MKTLITLKKDFSLTGPEAIDAGKEFDEMYALGRFSNGYYQYTYDSEYGIPLHFIKAVKDCIDTITIYDDRESIIDSIKLNGWIRELRELEFQSNININGLLPEEECDGKIFEPGFKVEICMPKSSHNEYYSIDEIESLLEFEDRLGHITGETDINKVEQFGGTLKEKNPDMAQKIAECGFQMLANNDDISVFRIEGGNPIGNPIMEGSRIYIFDKNTESFCVIAESDLEFDLKAQKIPGDKISIANTTHSRLCVQPESTVYKEFSALCKFSQISKVKTKQTWTK